MLRKIFRRTALAWRQLIREKNRFLVALAGIAFANILMFAQMGFEASLFESSIAPHKSLDADLVILNPQFESLFSIKSFSKDRLYQALAVDGIESISPLYVALGNWKHPQTGRLSNILVFGIDPATRAFKLPEVNKNLPELQMLNSVLFDDASYPSFGPIAQLFKQNLTVEAELNHVYVKVTGLFTLGPSFAAYGNVITSDSNFLYAFPNYSADTIQIGLIKVSQNADVENVASNLRVLLPNDVMVLTHDDFGTAEKNHWETSTPIGFIFGIGVIVSFIVGSVIVYQILYANVCDHLPEYATLKAIGYSDHYFFAVLAQEAFLLAVFGYIPGFILSLILYRIASSATILPIFMTPQRAINVFIVTLIMCIIAGSIAMRKLHSADPADVF